MVKIAILLVVFFFCYQTGEACYKSEWSRWINDHQPSSTPFPEERREGITTGGGGDKEDMNQTERDSFCAPGHGSINNIECQTSDGRNSITTAQAHLVCSADTGFKCANRLLGPHQTCLDYKIRLFCQCDRPLTSISTLLSTDEFKGKSSTAVPGGSKGQQISNGVNTSKPAGSPKAEPMTTKRSGTQKILATTSGNLSPTGPSGIGNLGGLVKINSKPVTQAPDLSKGRTHSKDQAGVRTTPTSRSNGSGRNKGHNSGKSGGSGPRAAPLWAIGITFLSLSFTRNMLQ